MLESVDDFISLPDEIGSSLKLISVIIANRNNGQYLGECLASVFAQSYPAIEIVVVDDSSSDDSLAILEPLAAAGKIRLLVNVNRLGVSESRRRGIAACHGELLTTLDADDFFADVGKLQREACVVGDSGHRIGFSDVLRVGADGHRKHLVSTKRKVAEGNLSDSVRYLSGFIPRDYLVRREDYEAAGGYDPTLELYEDWDLKIRLSAFCTWHYTGATGTAYRENPRGLSRAPSRIHVMAMRRIFRANCTGMGTMAKAGAWLRFFIRQSIFLRRPAI